MIYLIFTQEGFTEAKNDILQDKSELWISANLLLPEQLAELSAHGISIYFLPVPINPNDEKAILAALDYVEKQSANEEILVEYP